MSGKEEALAKGLVTDPVVFECVVSLTIMDNHSGAGCVTTPPKGLIPDCKLLTV